MSDKYKNWPPIEGVDVAYGDIQDLSQHNLTSDIIDREEVIKEVFEAVTAFTVNSTYIPKAPIVSYEMFPDEMIVGQTIDFYPDVQGSNLTFELHDGPSGMVIDSKNGKIEFRATRKGEYNGITVRYSNEHYSETVNLDLTVNNQWYRENDIIEYYDSKRYSESKGWPSSNRNSSKGFINNSVTQKPKLIKRFFNNHNIMYFDGIDDVLRNKTNPYNHPVKSGVIIFKPEMESEGFAQLFGNYDFGIHLGIDNRSGNKNGYSFDGNRSSDFKNKGMVVDLDGEFIKGEYSENSNDVVWKNNEWNKIYFEFDQSLTMTDEFHLGALESKGSD